ncbi:endonuclease/exonuclease/phosphatase family protein [Haloferula helveola]|uniref:Endonuclease/exonuclease/phosphatase family protein n=1 Tax=Haloferula helveola TaxID=490095 RepID=A0ABN6H9B8_9BACT|nr:endonuclease/exonuclease/phosphatase family protein [Haloferula helveola]
MRLALLLLLFASPMVLAEPLRVMCWNIHHGQGMDRKTDLERIAQRITEEKADLVALQEVDKLCGRSGKVDQAVELGRLTGLTPVFGKAMDFGGGEYGLAVLSRLPVVSHRVHRLPGEGEPRIALEVTVRDGDRKLSIVSVHLDHQDDGRRIAQAKFLASALEESPKVILCGDFNDIPGSQPLAVFNEDWKTAQKEAPGFTYSSTAPVKEIDHALVKGLRVVGKVRVIEDRVSSDHRPFALQIR